MDKGLVFIGGGNIAQAILSGLIPTIEHPETIVADRAPSKAQDVRPLERPGHKTTWAPSPMQMSCSCA